MAKNIMFISHGGGPLPLLGDPNHAELVSSLKSLAQRIEKPSAILLVSAHWEERVATVTTAQNPSLIYDYVGFPPESYRIQYPAPGEPALAQKVLDALAESGIQGKADAKRGFDHGMFVPLTLMYPEADIPCVQLSLEKNLNAQRHIEIGQALQKLDYDNLLVIGSGFSFHNMYAFFSANTPDTIAKNTGFETWLTDICMDAALSQEARNAQLANWEKIPSARYCHPREEHLLPLHVCSAMAGQAATEHEAVTVLGKESSMFLWSAV